LADDAESEVQRIESDIEQVRKQISQLSSDNAILQLEADSLQEDIDFLLSLDEEEEQPLDANKVTFQTLYDKKDDK
jgi:regulator of replication initiation timing